MTDQVTRNCVTNRWLLCVLMTIPLFWLCFGNSAYDNLWTAITKHCCLRKTNMICPHQIIFWYVTLHLILQRNLTEYYSAVSSANMVVVFARWVFANNSRVHRGFVWTTPGHVFYYLSSILVMTSAPCHPVAQFLRCLSEVIRVMWHMLCLII